MYHIKRDGGWLCKPHLNAKFIRKHHKWCRDGEVDYNHALKILDLRNCCTDCREKLQEKIENSKEVIIVPYVNPTIKKERKPLKTILITEGVIKFNGKYENQD